MVYMKVLSLGKRSVAVLAALGLAVGGTVVSAQAATAPAFIDCQLFAAGEPDHIDPALTSTLVGANVATMLFDGLTDTDANGALYGEVASKWKTTDGSKTWVFTLKKNLKFSNGEAVLPSSFVNGWKRALDSKLASEVAYHGDFILGMSAYSTGKGAFPSSSVVADDKAMTLTVKMENPTSDWPAIVGHSVFSPIPTTMVGASDKVEEDGTKLVGNGPFMLEKAITKRAGGEVVLVPNPNFGGKTASLSKLTAKIFSDTNAAYNAFASGQCDSGPIPAGRYTELLTKWGTKGLKSTLGTDYWGFNWEDPIVGGAKNKYLRSAISKAIDRDQISTVIYQGIRKPASGLLPPGLPGYKSGQGLTSSRDLAGAKADYKRWLDAGNTTPPAIRLSYNDGAGWDKVASIIIANLKDVGIPAKLDPFAADGTYFSKMRSGKGQMIRAGWFADYPIADNFLYPLLHSASIGGDNLERYNSKTFDALVNSARSTTNKAFAESQYRRAEVQALRSDVAITQTVNRGISVVLSTSIATFPITPLGMVVYDQVVKN
jgi:ABC-type oligopeptide transport system substrate-binding subunit